MKAAGHLLPTLKKAVQKGAFIKHCPCSPGAVPCGYFNLNLQTGCPFACSYCILQAYLEDKTRAVFYTNWLDLEDELQKFLAVNKEVRIGTGELSDSWLTKMRARRQSASWNYSGAFRTLFLNLKPKRHLSSLCWQ